MIDISEGGPSQEHSIVGVGKTVERRNLIMNQTIRSTAWSGEGGIGSIHFG
jgi:hypothetical protein